ncbi:MAG: hypothetical protein CVU71_10485 [Deltaproteobacteria bacterium HGW-Deltaproteobacteria-6]|nr:MAG: hypothetical protein CVU71_10485 [Deltaproteobacteria bacterium HGW-Deltaproteobacteria-6]
MLQTARVIYVVRPGALLIKNSIRTVISMILRFDEISNHPLHTGEIYIIKDSPQCVRDAMIALDQMIGSLGSPEAILDQLHIYLGEENQYQQFAELFSCLQLYPSVRDIEFHRMPLLLMREHAEKFIRKDNMNVSDELLVVFDQKFLYRQDIKRIHGNCTRLHVNLRVWAKNIIKMHSPLTFLVAMDMGGFSAFSSSQWRDFFLKAWQDFPWIHFILFDKAIAAKEDFQTGLPNITVTKSLGYNFIEEYALCQLSDMYMGSFSKYAMAVIGREKPFYITGENDHEAGAEYWKSGAMIRIGQKNDPPGRVHVPASADLYEQFRHFYTCVRAYDQERSS